MNIRRALLLSVGASIALSGQAYAQEEATSPAAEAPQGQGLGDIVVTARKRSETSIAVPVVVSAVSAADLDRRAIHNIDGIARAVPQLIVGEGGGTPQGGIIAIRGISGADSNPFGDQAVSFNIDGVQVARASVRRMTELDIQQVEVLKGPQALFFGKNSPGGVISIQTADPTKTFKAKISTGYEFNADETRTEGFVSGPLTNTLGFRLAGYYSHMKGYADNVAPRTGAGVFPPTYNRDPHQTEYAGRATLKWEPSDKFSARLKFSYANTTGDSSTANVQLVSCPLGTPQTGTADNCVADNKTTVGSIGTAAGQSFDPRFGDGSTFLHQHQYLGGLELNYNPNEKLTITSVTGYYKVTIRNRADYTANYLETGAPPRQILGSYNFVDIRELTEELRATTKFEGPINFMIGGLYQDSHAVNGSVTFRNAIAPAFVNNYRLVQNGIAYSLFAQALIDPIEKVEIAVGARYSYERKKLPVKESAFADTTNGGTTSGTLINLNANGTPVASFNNLSPEVTVRYRPTNHLTVYGSYKEGFLSGGFNSGAANLLLDNRYGQQKIQGFEGGIKGAFFNNHLRANLALYTYKTKGLQVSVTTEGTVQELRNAGSVRTKGVEFDMSWLTPVTGLELTGAVSYNRGRYLDYQASCYRGESSALCYTQYNRQTGTVGLLQDLSGTQLVRAPTWTGNVGFNYQTPIFSGFKLNLSGNMSHSDSYWTDVTSTPGGRQPSYELYDATVSVGPEDDRWQLALIGRNLSNTYYFVRSTDNPFSGSAPGAALVGTLGDTAASISRGREIMLRLSVSFGGR